MELVLRKGWTSEHLNRDYDYLSLRTPSNVYTTDSNDNTIEFLLMNR